MQKGVRAMRFLVPGCIVLLSVVVGCASQATSSGRSAVRLGPVPVPEALPLQQNEGPIVVRADPAVPPERVQAVLGTALPTRLAWVLPMEVVIHNHGPWPMRLSQADIALELPDGSQLRPLPVATLVPWRPAQRYVGGTQDRAALPRQSTEYCAPPKQSTEYCSTTEATAASVFWTVLGLAALLSEQHGREDATAAHVVASQRKAFQEVVLAQGTSAHGMVFFPAPEERGFHEATLRLRFVAAEAGPDVVVRLPLHRVEGSGRGGNQ
jgi:hypothetical protein